jgi:hypothetical protein
VARQTTTPPLIFDLLAAEPFSMRVLGPLLWLYDHVDTGLAETPAFRDIDGDCAAPHYRCLQPRTRVRSYCWARGFARLFGKSIWQQQRRCQEPGRFREM